MQPTPSHRPSPAMVVAVVALIAAVGGPALAHTVSGGQDLSSAAKKKAKVAQARLQIQCPHRADERRDAGGESAIR